MILDADIKLETNLNTVLILKILMIAISSQKGWKDLLSKMICIY
jgi:hypothetical protein